MGANEAGSGFGLLVKWLVIGFVALVALRLGLVAVGVLLRFALAVVFTLGPILLVGWLVLKLLRYLTRERDTITV